MPIFPALSDALKAIGSGFGSEPLTLDLKSTIASFSTTDEWYQRNGYYGIAGAVNGYGSSSGITVTTDRALEISGLYAGVKIIAQDMGTLPFFTYERGQDAKGRETLRKYREHPLFSTLHDLVNPDTSSGEFVEALTAHACLTGDGLARIQRQGDSVFLWQWMPGETRIDKDSRGLLYYIHREIGGNEKTYTRSEVFHLRGFTMAGTTGDDLLRRGRQVLGLSSAQQEYAAKYFSNDATPGVVIRFPVDAPAIHPDGLVKFKEQWAKWHRGNPHEPAVIQQGGVAEVLRPNAAASQINEQRKFQLLEVCRLLTLPPHRLADLERSTLANVEQMSIEYGKFSLSPWGRRWRDAVYRCLLTRDEQLAGQVFAEQSIEALQRGDFAVQSEGWRKLLEKGVYSINDVRGWLNLNPVDGGEEHLVQLNLGAVQDVAAGLAAGVSVQRIGNSAPVGA